MKMPAPPGYEWVKVTDLEITQRIWDGPDCYPWREVRAWLPVKTISGRYVWGSKVYKRKFWAVWGTGFHMEPQVEYAELFEILKYEN
jgi:hypothetical protein